MKNYNIFKFHGIVFFFYSIIHVISVSGNTTNTNSKNNLENEIIISREESKTPKKEVTKKNKVLYDGKGNLIEKIKAKKEIITKQKKVICIEKIIVREKSNKVLIFSTFSNLGLGTPVDEYNSLLSSYFNFGSSIEFSLPFNINTTMLLPHLRAEINIVNFQNSVYGATFQLGLSYRFLSSSWLSNLRGEIFTSIMTGLAHFEIRTNNLVDFQQNYVISPIVGYEVFFNRIQVFLHLKADIIGDAQTPLISMGVNIGAGYYF